MEKLSDHNGNRYWRDSNRKIWLELKEVPKSGKRLRQIARVRKGILYIKKRASEQFRVNGYWYVNKFLLKQEEEFHFNIVKFEASIVDGGGVKGWFYPKMLLLKNANHIRFSSGGYELQIELRASDLSRTPKQAKKILESVEQEHIIELRRRAEEKEFKETGQPGLFPEAS